MRAESGWDGQYNGWFNASQSSVPESGVTGYLSELEVHRRLQPLLGDDYPHVVEFRMRDDVRVDSLVAPKFNGEILSVRRGRREEDAVSCRQVQRFCRRSLSCRIEVLMSVSCPRGECIFGPALSIGRKVSYVPKCVDAEGKSEEKNHCETKDMISPSSEEHLEVTFRRRKCPETVGEMHETEDCLTVLKLDGHPACRLRTLAGNKTYLVLHWLAVIVITAVRLSIILQKNSCSYNYTITKHLYLSLCTCIDPSWAYTT